MLKLSPKILFLTVSFVILTNQSIVSGASLKCEYQPSSSGNWRGLEEAIYYCLVNDNGIFTDARVIIDSVEEAHSTGMTNANVQGLRMAAIASIKFLPQNLENIFENLIFISICLTNLKEIKQHDLKVFTKLKCLQIYNNKITTVDQDLFKFNPKLRAILLNDNQISHIDPNVFDHLDNLIYLWLQGNQCKNALSRVDNSRSAVLKLVERVRNGECASSDILQKKEAIKDENDECTTEKSTMSKQVNELEGKLREAEKINLEQVTTKKTLQDRIQELNNDLTKIQAANQELKAKNDNLSLLHGKCESKHALSDTISEKFFESNDKMNEWKDKYINSLQTNKAENQNLNEKLHECNNKYITLLHAKLIESEKVVIKQNEEIKNINKVNKDADDGQKKSSAGDCTPKEKN